MLLRTLDDLPKNLKGKRVLVHVDWNVPLDGQGRPASLFKMKASLPTIRELRARGAVLVLFSHLGRPGGKPVVALSMRKILPAARRLLRAPITLLPLPRTNANYQLPITNYRRLFLFENIRFDPREEGNDVAFARALARYGDYTVNESFGASYNTHASFTRLLRLLPSVAGRRLEEEFNTLSELTRSPQRPFVVVLSGAKISTKIKLIRAMLGVCDQLLVGGAIANTLLRARGVGIGASLAEPMRTRDWMTDGKLLLPRWDVVVSQDPKKSKGMRVVSLDRGERIEANEWIVDLGPRTVRAYSDVLKQAKTILWNGPVGIQEVKAFQQGTFAIARVIAGRKKSALTIVGGGETMDVVEQLKLYKKFDFCSTGGGAMLEFLEGKKLPGIIPLLKKH